MHRFVRFIACSITTVIEIVRVPLFLLRHRHRIFYHGFVYPCFSPSFGHSIVELDYLSRLYAPHRVSVVYFSHPGNNDYLPDCFSQSLTTVLYRQAFLIPNIPCTKQSWQMMRFFLLMVAAFKRNVHCIDQAMFYKTLSVANNALQFGREETGKLENDDDYSGYFHLLDRHIGPSPMLRHDLIVRCREAIKKKYPHFFDKPFITLLLRQKGLQKEHSTAFRSSGPQENYQAAVQFATENGWHIVGTGETDHRIFGNIPGYFDFGKTGIPPQLMNVFLLTQCRLFVGQISGPYLLPSSCGIQCIITDAMPHRLGVFGRDHLVIHKRLQSRRENRTLSLVEIFREHKDLAFGYNFGKKGITILPNTPEEILEAVQEGISILEGQFTLSSEDDELIKKFRLLPSAGMHLLFQANRPSLAILHRLREQRLL